MLAVAEARGLSRTKLLAEAGLTEAELRDADGRVPLVAETALWELVAAQARAPHLGLDVAGHITPGAFGIVDYLVRASADILEAITRLGRYNRLLHDVAEIGHTITGSTVRVWHRPRAGHGPLSRHAVEFTVASWLVISRQTLGERWVPRAVYFAHPRPKDLTAHQALFGAPLHFAAAENALVLDLAVARRRFLAADEGLNRLLGAHADLLLERLGPADEPLVARVRRVVGPLLRDGDPSADDVAARLHMSARSLQRKLAGEGTSLREVVDALRHELAVELLAEPRHSIAEVAFLLGFSEARAFHRAFKRWTGQTPGAFREAHG